MSKIVYTRNSAVEVVYAAPKHIVEQVLGPLTDEQFAAHVMQVSVPVDATNVQIVDDSAIPSDREFRAAWQQEGRGIGFDLVRAKEIQLERIRGARASKLAALDVSFMLAIEQGDAVKQTEVAAAKQALRDITEPLKALDPKSINDIKNAFPQELKGV